jgi:hypothetical protein
MKASLSAAAAFLALASAAISAERVPRLQKNSDYRDARASLIALGWVPVRLETAEECDGDRRCVGRPEMVSCSGTGLGYCVFAWRKGETLIEVITAGEDEPGVSAVRCRVNCRR